MDFESLKQVLEDAAKRAGLTEYEIYRETEEQISVDTLKQEISAFSSGVSGGVCFRCIVNGKLGSASGELMTPEAMEDLVARAVSNASVVDSTDVPEIFAGSPSYASTDIPKPVMPSAAELKQTALSLQKATYAACDKVGDGTQSGAVATEREIFLSNSKGLSLHNHVGMCGVWVYATVRDGEEVRDAQRTRAGIEESVLEDLPRETVNRAISKLGATTVKSGKYNVVFDGEQFRSFLSTFSSVFSAKAAQKGLSRLAGKEHTLIANPIVSLVDDPMREGSPMQTPFDGEGVATSRKYVVENGVLNTLLYDLTTAKKAGIASTGNGRRGGYASPISIYPYHFSLMPGTSSLEELLAEAGDGIYITECKGFHAGASEVTGDFSIESAGFRIRDGKRAEPIQSFTVAGNFFDVLKNLSKIGDTVRWPALGGFTAFGSPDVLVPMMSIAGKD